MTGRFTAAVLNAASGDGSAEKAQETLERLFGEAGRAVRVVLVGPDDDLRTCAQEVLANGPECVIAGGGDGTINGVAGLVAGTGIPLGVLPLGTLNHFAKDLGIPLEIEPAIRTILDGHSMAVDVGEVNDLVFLNNSSLGLYPRLVQLRQEHGARGIGKWFVAAWAAVRVMRECPMFAVRLEVDGHVVLRRTPMVFIGNNEYQMEGLDAGSRATLAGGQLAIYIVKEKSGLRLLGLILRIVTGSAKKHRQLDMLRVREATIETTHGELPVAIDGEVETVATPLSYGIRPGALTVLVPRENETRPDKPGASSNGTA